MSLFEKRDKSRRKTRKKVSEMSYNDIMDELQKFAGKKRASPSKKKKVAKKKTAKPKKSVPKVKEPKPKTKPRVQKEFKVREKPKKDKTIKEHIGTLLKKAEDEYGKNSGVAKLIQWEKENYKRIPVKSLTPEEEKKLRKRLASIELYNKDLQYRGVCYGVSQTIAMQDKDFDYYEGYMKTDKKITPHAWLVYKGKIIDIALGGKDFSPNQNFEYHGVKIPAKEVSRINKDDIKIAYDSSVPVLSEYLKNKKKKPIPVIKVVQPKKEEKKERTSKNKESLTERQLDAYVKQITYDLLPLMTTGRTLTKQEKEKRKSLEEQLDHYSKRRLLLLIDKEKKVKVEEPKKEKKVVEKPKPVIVEEKRITNPLILKHKEKSIKDMQKRLQNWEERAEVKRTALETDTAFGRPLLKGTRTKYTNELKKAEEVIEAIKKNTEAEKKHKTKQDELYLYIREQLDEMPDKAEFFLYKNLVEDVNKNLPIGYALLKSENEAYEKFSRVKVGKSGNKEFPFIAVYWEERPQKEAEELKLQRRYREVSKKMDEDFNIIKRWRKQESAKFFPRLSKGFHIKGFKKEEIVVGEHNFDYILNRITKKVEKMSPEELKVLEKHFDKIQHDTIYHVRPELIGSQIDLATAKIQLKQIWNDDRSKGIPAGRVYGVFIGLHDGIPHFDIIKRADADTIIRKNKELNMTRRELHELLTKRKKNRD